MMSFPLHISTFMTAKNKSIAGNKLAMKKEINSNQEANQ